MKHYVSNKRETPRMFESSFMEFFSRVHWSVPLLLFLPIIGLLLYAGAEFYLLSSTEQIWLYLAGLIIWTFVEYSLHRFVFHYKPRSEWGRKFHWTFHGVHHDYPSDPLRLVMVPAVSLPLATAFYFLFVLIMDYPSAAPFTGGFLTGYLFYDITHYAVHHFPIKGRVFGSLREWHMRHHFQDPDNGYGVSSPIWDHIFRTTLARKKAAA